jgi:hypothetical protein
MGLILLTQLRLRLLLQVRFLFLPIFLWSREAVLKVQILPIFMAAVAGVVASEHRAAHLAVGEAPKAQLRLLLEQITR